MYDTKKEYREYIERKQLKSCDDCDMIFDFEKNYELIKERKCIFCVIYWAADLPCDTCDDGIADWFYCVATLGKRGICQKCHDAKGD